MGSASLVFWCRTARSRRSGHQCSLRVILRELCVTAPCMGEAVSVLVDGSPPCGTGHFASFDIFTPSFSLLGNLSPIGPRRPTVSEFWLSHPTGEQVSVVKYLFCSLRTYCNLLSSVSEWIVLAAFGFLTRGTDSNDVDSVTFHQKATR